MSGPEISMNAKLSFQAINQFEKESAKGQLQGRLVIKEAGDDLLIAYEKFSKGEIQPAGQIDKASLEMIKEFCQKHKIQWQHLDKLTPTDLVFRQVLDRSGPTALIEDSILYHLTTDPKGLGSIRPPVTLSDVKQSIGKLSFNEVSKGIDAYKKWAKENFNEFHTNVFTALKEAWIQHRLTTDSNSIRSIEPQFTLKEVKQLIGKLPYDVLCKSIDAYKKSGLRTKFDKEVFPLLMDQERKLAKHALKEYNDTFPKKAFDESLMDSGPSNWQGSKELLNWAVKNDKHDLANALLRRTSPEQIKKFEDERQNRS